MGFNQKPVILEEYNQTLRDTVNEYYTHTMNDPTMSREEAIQSAGEVAENYHNAVEAFQEAQMQNDGTAYDAEEAGDVSASGDSPDAGNDLDGGEGCDGGVDF